MFMVFLLDLSFLSVAVTLIILFPALLIEIFYFNSVKDWTGNFLLINLIFWFILTILMFLHWCKRKWEDTHYKKIWLYNLFINPFSGALSYYLNIFRKDIKGITFSTREIYKKRKCIFDVLYFLTFYGTLFAVILSITPLLLFNILPQKYFSFFSCIFYIFGVTLPITFISYLIFDSFLLLDATQRPISDWEETNYLKYINPWAWIFGLRRYFEIMKEEIE